MIGTSDDGPLDCGGEDAAERLAGELEAGWELAGSDGEGRPVRLLFGETELKRAYPGLTVGRHPLLADLVIADAAVSRRHLRIWREGEHMVVEDLNSLNGTYLDGERLPPFEAVAVHPGQVLVLGGTTLTLRLLAG